MRPNIDPAVAAELAKPYVQLVILFEFLLPQDPAYLFNGWGRLEVAGKTYLGTGQFGQVAETRETVNGRVSGASYILSGVATPEGQSIFAALRAAPDDTPVRQLIAFFNPVTQDVIGAPILLREDQFDTFSRGIGITDQTLTVTAEPPGMDRGLTGPPRYTPQSHRDEFSGDTGMDLQPQVGKIIFDMDVTT